MESPRDPYWGQNYTPFTSTACAWWQSTVEEYGISIKQYSDYTAIYLEFGFLQDCLDQFDALRSLSKCAGD